MSEELDQVAALQRELAGTQEMLGWILLQVGAAVEVTKADLEMGVPEGAQIRIDDEGDKFVFWIEVPEEFHE